jgi:hypothetical protein
VVEEFLAQMVILIVHHLQHVLEENVSDIIE